MQHTPGPWFVGREDYDDWGIIRAACDMNPVACAKCEARIPFDARSGPCPRPCPAEVAANARLIAAAPTMLDLLEQVYCQAGNSAPAERRHALTPRTRDGIRDLLESLDRFAKSNS